MTVVLKLHVRALLEISFRWLLRFCIIRALTACIEHKIVVDCHLILPKASCRFWQVFETLNLSYIRSEAGSLILTLSKILHELVA